MSMHITKHRPGFAAGLTWVTRTDEPADNTGIAFGVLKLAAEQRYDCSVARETALLLMTGSAQVTIDGKTVSVHRDSLFDQAPYCVHLCAGTELAVVSAGDTEFTIYQTDNVEMFDGQVYQPEDVSREQRGKGQVGDTCWREVRTIFDATNSHAAATLVLGEVITLPGRWSSYPPHHHAQPEIYHYRFTKEQGYGHAELGDDVFKVRQFDTIKILNLNDHAQCAAPGYGMYYSWVIRHLPDKKYGAPDFTEEHRWIMDPGASCWMPEKSSD